MAGCGYVCPVCEGRGFDEEGNICSWCSPLKQGPDEIEKDKDKKDNKVED